MYRTEVSFPDALPSFEVILQALSKNTGLAISTDPLERYFYTPIFPDEKQAITRLEDRILIWQIHDEVSYLFYATIATLISLGGKYNEELPDWAWKKWGEFTPPPETYTNRWLTIAFEEPPPSPEMILQKVRENTELDLSLVVNKEAFRLLHPIMDFNEVEFVSLFLIGEYRQSTIYLYIETETISTYVVESILAALIDLGGEYNKQLPDQAWQPWEQAKSYYQPLKD